MEFEKMMKVVSIVLAMAVLVVSALTLVPTATTYHLYLPYASLAAAGALLLVILVGWREKAPPARAKAEAGRPVTVPSASGEAEAYVVMFLAMLQQKGRLVDFLMDDVAAYNDEQVGAAARVVHEGCKVVLNEHFQLGPVREENEGSTVTIAEGYPADEYRLVGKISGSAPFSGTLVHRGWKTGSVTLPRVLRTGGDRLPNIAPAEVELK